MNCIECEHFKILYPPMGHYDSGKGKFHGIWLFERRENPIC